MPNRQQFHRWCFLAGLALVSLGLPFSKVMMSIGGLILAGNFLVEGNFTDKWQRLKSDKSIWLFVGVFVVHALSILWTDDIGRGFKDLRIKLPLLLFPIVLGLSNRISRKEFLWLLALFAGSVVLSTIFSTITYLEIRNIPGADFREISPFTSHIRYGLMVCLSFFILLNCAWNERKHIAFKISYLVLALWLGLFVFILQSMTGIIIWISTLFVLLFYTISSIFNVKWRRLGYALLFGIPLVCSLFIAQEVNEFYPESGIDYSQLDKLSEGGEFYTHDTTRLTKENGHYVFLYQAHAEMERSWNKVSNITFPNGRDANGNFIYSTLMRYLTSKGLRKDSVGVASLTSEDITAIEQGITNIKFLDGMSIENRLYMIIWEFDNLLNTSNPEGRSVVQRLEFWKTGWHVFRENWLLGVGNGDKQAAFDQMYDRTDSPLSEKYRLRSHNQFLSVGIATGSIGFLLFLASLIYPFIKLKNANSFLFIGFSWILYLSMLGEDTLETQTGVTLYAFFNALFLYALDALPSKESKAEE